MPEQSDNKAYPFRHVLYETLGNGRMQHLIYLKVVSVLFLIPVLFINPFGVAIRRAIPSLGFIGLIIGFAITVLFMFLTQYSTIGYMTLQQGLRQGDSDMAIRGVRKLKSWYQKLKRWIWISMLFTIFFLIIMGIIEILYATSAFGFILLIYSFSIFYRKVIEQFIQDIEIGLTEEEPDERFKPHARWLRPYIYIMIPVVMMGSFTIGIMTTVLELSGEVYMIIYMLVTIYICILLAKQLGDMDTKFIQFRRRRLDESKDSITDIINT